MKLLRRGRRALLSAVTALLVAFAHDGVFPPRRRVTMSGLVLDGFAAGVAALLVLGVLGVWAPRAAALGMAGLCGAGGLLALLYLSAGAPAAGLALPLGLPGMASVLALDGLSGFFLLLLMLAGTAAGVAALEADPAGAAFLPVFVAGMALTLLAGDGFSLVAGFELMSLASFVLVLGGGVEAALLSGGMAAMGGLCLIAAIGLLGGLPGGAGAGFAAMRAHPPEGLRAAVVLLLVLVGAGSKAGLAPLHVWLPPAHAAAPAHVSALMSGAMTKIALYVLIRLVFDICGPAQPLWWGVPLLVAGAASAVLGGLRASLEDDIKAVLACSTIENIGLIAIGLGLFLCARAVDLTPLAALALGGALLHALGHAMFKSLLFLGAGAVQHGAGTRRLARLGGLIGRMPVTTCCVLLGGACLAGLPPTAGFAGEWTLFQAVLGSPRLGGLGIQIVLCVVAALMALAVALAGAAAVRLIGVGFLGRPRAPRSAAAEEAGPRLRGAMLGLAAVAALIGLVPAGVLGLAGPALRLLSGADLADRASLLQISPQSGIGMPGYGALGIAALLAAMGGAVLALMRQHARRRGTAGHRTAPAWDCGYGAAPAWLPFGDPVTQYGAASFSQPLRATLGAALLGARAEVDMPDAGDTRAAGLTASLADPAEILLFARLARWRAGLSAGIDRMQFVSIRRKLMVMFAALVLLLAMVAVLEQR
jgi:formate hydrogenlyase subunit 3/multisubunit Na+/H+ antiporter MnhD subunit